MDRKTTDSFMQGADDTTDPMVLIAQARAMQADALARIFRGIGTAPTTMLRLIRQAIADRKHRVPRAAG